MHWVHSSWFIALPKLTLKYGFIMKWRILLHVKLYDTWKLKLSNELECRSIYRMTSSSLAQNAAHRAY